MTLRCCKILALGLLAFSLSACLKSGDDFGFLESGDDTSDNTGEIGSSAIEYTPASHDFGPLEAYSGSAGKVVTVTNGSSQAIYINSFSGANAHYNLVSDNCPRKPSAFSSGQSCQVTVQFAPQAPGTHLMTLEATYQVSLSDEVLKRSMGFSGQGVSPVDFDGIQSVSNITHNSMRLNWNATPDAKSFMIFRIDGSGNMNYQKTVANGGGTVTFGDVEGLDPNTAYKWRVRAVDALGNQEDNTVDLSATTTTNNAPNLAAIANPNVYTGEVLANQDANDSTTGNDLDVDGDQITYTCRYDSSLNGSMDGSAADCSSLVNESGGNASFSSVTGIFSNWEPQHALAGTNIEFQIIGTDPYGASSTVYFTSTIQAGTPNPPTITGISVVSPVNNNNPNVFGTTLANFTVKLYPNSTCTGAPIGSGTANGAGNFSVAATVPDNAITTIYATATNTIGNESNCSTTSATIVEDSSPPSPLVVTGTTPASPSTVLTPTINGSTEGNVDIEVFSDNTCSTSVATGTSDNFGNFSITVNAPVFTTSTYYVKATDAAGNVSPCSATFASYEAYEIAPGAIVLEGSETTAPSNSDNINQSTPYAIKWTQAYYDNSYYSHSSSSNSHVVTVTQAGSYFLSLTAPIAMSSLVLYRQAPRFMVYVNGSPHPYGVAESTYMRNANGHDESSAHVHFLIPNLNANDTVEVYTVNGSSDLSEVAITGKAKLFMEHVDTGTRSTFAASASASVNSTNLNQGTAHGLAWSSDVKDATNFTHDNSTNPDQVTLNSAGDYLVFVNLPQNSSSQRASVRISVELDGVRVAGGEATQGYIRSDTGHYRSTAHWSGLITGVTAGKVLRIRVNSAGGGGTVSVPAGTKASLFIEKIDTSSNVISLRATNLSGGSNWNPGSEQNILWSTQAVIDSTHFTHSTSTDSHLITVNNRGDYLLVYNDSFSSTVQRANPDIRVKVNGVQVPGAITRSHYIRSTSNHNSASGSLVFFLRDLQAGDQVSLTAVANATTGTVNLSEDTLLTLIKKR